MREHIATLAALLALLMIPATLLVDTRCFVALVACGVIFAIAERGLPLPLPRKNSTIQEKQS